MKHLEKQITSRKDLMDLTFRVPCPADETASNFENERSNWVEWMMRLGFDEPTQMHPNICCGSWILVCFGDC